ncbi:MAG: hypothetical protein K2P78_06725 [Gemmataceae bacterium]|nr:hypothetical protein [Gemmataceae bacterium]
MFPHPCGDDLEAAVAAGADLAAVVPDDYVVVRGGTSPLPGPGVVFSCSTGPTLEAAACAVPYGQMRATTAGAIRAAGGTVAWKAEFSHRRTMNKQHVHVAEPGATTFGGLRPNPAPKAGRIDGGK